jgi:hypothetical protein
MWEGGRNFGAEKRLKKINNFGQGGCIFGSSQNGLNGPILNCCIGGCWFTPASLEQVNMHDEFFLWFCSLEGVWAYEN